MKTQKLAVTLGTALLMGFCVMAQELGIDFTGGGYSLPYYNWNLGYEFQVTSPVTVVGLAAWDYNAPGGMPVDVPVGLWEDSGSLLASATITAGTLPISGDLFAEVGITPIVLNPGYYDVAAIDAYAFGNSSYWPSFTGFTVAPGISYVEDRFVYGSFSYPDQTDIGSYGSAFRGFFGGNIVLGVPDASSALMLLSGACLALGAVRRKLA